MALTGWHVNGPALVYTGTGASNALELLGYTENGADVRVQKNVAELFSDVLGPMTPADFQDMGEVAEITCPFVVTDRTVLAKITSRGDRTTAGQLNTPGMVIGASNYTFRLGIAGPSDSPWNFPYAILRPGFNMRLATKMNPFVLSFFAGPFPAFTVTAGKDLVVWNRTLS